MQFLARLVHAEHGARVVEVSARERGEVLGRCLGEGATAELAEERARQRLLQLLTDAGRSSEPAAAALPTQENGTSAAGPGGAAARPAPAAAPTRRPPSSQAPIAGGGQAPAASAVPAAMEPLPGKGSAETEGIPEPAPDPEDWSAELAQIDLQLRRLGWQREQEGIYLDRAFGHPSRSRITSYADLMAYLQALQAMVPGALPEAVDVPLRRRDLLAQCDALLTQLAWDANQGRQLLEQHFQLSSRQQLNESQLLQFNMLLEETLMRQTTLPAVAS
jgi:hypothetical protein